jgi:hypothetical protein
VGKKNPLADPCGAFAQVMPSIIGHRTYDRAFDELLDVMLCCLAGGTEEERYLEIVKAHPRATVEKMAEAFAACMVGAQRDVLGTWFEEHLSHGRNGQFFTPWPVARMMAQMTVAGAKPGQTVCDPACGSGRMLLAAAEVERGLVLFGADVDHRCVKMAAINLRLAGLSGEVAWMDSLRLKHWGGYQIGPTIRRLGAGEGLLAVTPPPQAPAPPVQSLPVLAKPEQMMLFEEAA